MFGIGSQELLILFLIVLILFGAERIPEVARAVGKSVRDFKRAAGEIETEIQQVTRHKDLLSGKDPDRGGRAAGAVKGGPREKSRGESEDGKSTGVEDAPEASHAGEKVPETIETGENAPEASHAGKKTPKAD